VKPESVKGLVEGTVYVPTVPPQSETATRPLPRQQRQPRESRDRWQVPERASTATFISTLPPAPSVDVDPRTLLAADTGAIIVSRSSGRGPGRGPGFADGEPATAGDVDRIATMTTTPRPRYPDQLRAAGVTGRVVVRLVIDTTGRVEAASVVIREASHELFAQSVRAILPSLRFSPAEARGRKVRMLADLPFEFRLHD
jgi:TonB family protein